jgi:hypothetical protein
MQKLFSKKTHILEPNAALNKWLVSNIESQLSNFHFIVCNKKKKKRTTRQLIGFRENWEYIFRGFFFVCDENLIKKRIWKVSLYLVLIIWLLSSRLNRCLTAHNFLHKKANLVKSCSSYYKYLKKSKMMSHILSLLYSNCFQYESMNPNPHCFIATAKATACGWKEPLLPHPLHTVHNPVGGGGRGVLPLRPCRFA